MNQLMLLSNTVFNLDPDNIIDKGFAILQTSDNKIINKSDNISIGQNINIKMKNYNFKSQITDS